MTAQSAHDPGIPGAYVILLLDVVARWNIPESALLDPFQLTRDHLTEPQCRVPAHQLNSMLRMAHQLTGEASLGYHMGAQMRISTHGFIGFAVMTTSTVGQAVELITRFIRIRMPYCQVHLLPYSLDSGALVFDLPIPLEPLRSEILLSLCIGLTLMGRTLLGYPVEGQLDMDFDRPAGFERFEPLLSVRVRFNQPVCQAIFVNMPLDTPISMADPVASHLALQQCEAELQQLGQREGVAMQVRNLLVQHTEGFPNIEQVAQQLHMSDRTLKRQLAAEHTSFSQILENVRHRRAITLLAQPGLSMEQIAEQLGYSEVGNFIRAFRRWTGRTPARWRREPSVAASPLPEAAPPVPEPPRTG